MLVAHRHPAGAHAPADARAPRGRYRGRFAQGAADMRAVWALRAVAFRGAALAQEAQGEAVERDRFDARFRHAMVEEVATGALAACFRMASFADGRGIAAGYAACHHDLSRLSGYPAPLAEIGRFCVRPGLCDPDVVRVAWGMIARIVDDEGIGLVFGCTSFSGTDPAPYARALSAACRRNRAPARWRPGARAPAANRGARVLPLARLAAPEPEPEPPAGRPRALPGLLRVYLRLGGWIGDHAVIDPDLNSFHVLTGLEIARIPPARAAFLRKAAQFAQTGATGAIDHCAAAR